MRHRIKKIPTLSKLSHMHNHHLLHSDKSTYTYFYKDKVKSLLYSPSIPLLGGVTLLLVLGLMVCPSSGTDNDNKAYAYEVGDTIVPCAEGVKDLSLTLLNNSTSSLSTEVKANEVSYIAQRFKVRNCGYDNYALYAQAAPEHTSKLQGRDNTAEFIEGVGNEVSPTDFTSNQWGYAIADNTTNIENSNLKYSTLPENGTTTTPAYSEQGTMAGKYFKIVFAAKIGNDKPADHYGTEVLLSLVARAGEVTTMYSLSYDGNGNTGGTAPTTESKESSEDTETFTVAGAGDLEKTGYTFAGWAETNNATTAQYQPGSQIELTTNAPTKTLFAIWKVPFNGITTMQQMTNSICTAASIGEPTTLKDTRDQSTYTIKKLSDEKCWMTQNLKIVNKAITSADSDVDSSYTIPASSSPWSSSDGATTNKVHYANNTIYGAYYSWYTATAGTGTSDVISGQAPGSICPKGWRLPTGGKSGEFQTLVNKGKSSWTTNDGASGYWFGGTLSSTSGATFFPAAGSINGMLDGNGKIGLYWSSNPWSYDFAYYLDFTSDAIFDSNYNYGRRSSGLSVRCIAR